MTETEQKLKEFLMNYATVDEIDNIANFLSIDDFDSADQVIQKIIEREKK